MSPLAYTPVGTVAPVKVQASGDLLTKITNRKGGKLYYKSIESVSSSSNDGTLEEGQSVTVATPVYLISASTSYATYDSIAFNDKGAKRWQTFHANSSKEIGNDTAYVAGSIYYIELRIGFDSLLTGIEILNGSVAETNKLCGILFNQGGEAVANSATAGILAAGAKGYQALVFTELYRAPAGRYFVGIQCNGTTAKFYSAKVGSLNMPTGSTTGEFGKFPNITPPTTFTENVGPIAVTY